MICTASSDFRCAILLGATASGKSAIADILAPECVLLSADSMAVYRELSIISAKPEGEYFGVDLVSINDSFNVGDFLREFERAKAAAIAARKPLLIVGGSSFYLNALLQGLSDSVPALSDFPENEQIYALMQAADAGAKINAQDTYRLRRWYEIYTHCKIAPSEFLAQTKRAPLLENALIYELCWDKEALIERINLRSKNMLASGAVAECAQALALAGWPNKALASIGAKQICEKLLELCGGGADGGAGGGAAESGNSRASGDFALRFLSAKSLQKAARALELDSAAMAQLAELISIKTRQYAKRQRTFNRQMSALKLDGSAEPAENARRILQDLALYNR